MKRYTQAIFIIGMILAAGGLALYLYLSSRSAAPKNIAPVRFRTLTIGETEDVDSPEEELELALSSAVELKPSETLLDIYSLKFDTHNIEDTQLLVIRDSNDPFGYLRIAAAYFSAASQRWLRSWDGVTLATMLGTFQLRVLDVSGDSVLSLVCSGMNDKNEQTMTVFRQSVIGGVAQDLTFTEVFSGSANNIRLEDTLERPESYKLGQSKAAGYEISVWRKDPESANQLDQVKETWSWDDEVEYYVLARTTKIAGNSVQQQEIERILDGSIDTFTAYLSGTWYKESTNPLSEEGQFLVFQPEDEAILFATNNSIELMRWETSSLTRYGVYITSRNQAVRNLRRLLNIELSSPSSIEVRILQDMRIKIDINKRWDGQYRKMPPELEEAFRRSPAMAQLQHNQQLEGEYQAANGSSLVLSGSTYTLSSVDGVEEGSFTVSQLGEASVLQFQAQTLSGTAITRRSSYMLEISNQTGSGSTIRTLLLKPVQLSIHGWEPLNKPTIQFETSRE
ncbi:MAG: pallilysin-related adhesin [Spirochaetes bacterium]|nr:pallilysin-related adhesin [Spirochaetota bacterium]MBU0957167.1 pallilysin-related adhesin [Spirochaetota bacterium]